MKILRNRRRRRRRRKKKTTEQNMSPKLEHKLRSQATDGGRVTVRNSRAESNHLTLEVKRNAASQQVPIRKIAEDSKDSVDGSDYRHGLHNHGLAMGSVPHLVLKR